MKNIVLIWIVCLSTLFHGSAQHSTLELMPSFQKVHKHYISEPLILSSYNENSEFIGLSFYHENNFDAQVEYRVLSEGNWSSWNLFRELHEFVSEHRRAYEAKAIDVKFEKIQFKSSVALNKNFRFRFFFPNKKPSYLKANFRSLNCEEPDYCDRDCWCSTCPVDTSPEITIPTHIIVHHSAGFNTSNDFSTVVEYYWDLHVNTNGWDDIGYNWLVDPNGVLYQGRPDNYQGAHFSCINENTIGVCMIGDYTSTIPSQEAQDMLVSLIGFEAVEHQIDILDSSYHETGDFEIANVSGHRDGNSSQNACSATVCPGDSFYPLLENIRTAVNALECYQDAISTTNDLQLGRFKIYPNPFTDKLYIESTGHNSELRLVSATGVAILQLTTNTVISTSHLSAGLYFILENGKIVQRLIKL